MTATALHRIRRAVHRAQEKLPSGWWFLPAVLLGWVGWYFIWLFLKGLF